MIEVKDLTKKYGETAVVDHISFTVGDGEILGFLGPNGAGKSTTMNISPAISRPPAGRQKLRALTSWRTPLRRKSTSATCRSTRPCTWI